LRYVRSASFVSVSTARRTTRTSPVELVSRSFPSGLSARTRVSCRTSAQTARRAKSADDCVDPRLLDRSLAGREYDEQLLADLPPNVDPCGENGEFHTFVYAGPIFGSPLRCERGATVARDGFVFCDLLEQGA
jgi:hypothetical protein